VGVAEEKGANEDGQELARFGERCDGEGEAVGE